jgi:hypothetical protein
VLAGALLLLLQGAGKACAWGQNGEGESKDFLLCDIPPSVGVTGKTKTAFVSLPTFYRSDHFTKTGSGRTHGESAQQKRTVFRAVFDHDDNDDDDLIGQVRQRPFFGPLFV